jgi:CRP-like cAMP-binding protein
MGDIVEASWFDALVAQARRVNLPAGHVLHHAGQPDSSVDILVSGTVEVWHTSAEGQEVWLGNYGRGDTMGTLILSGHKLPGGSSAGSYDRVAASNIALLCLSPTAFQALCADYPDLGLWVAARGADLLEASRTALIGARLLSAKGRVAAELLRLSASNGESIETRIIRPNPVLANLARRAGTTRETASRTVTALCKSGVLERRPGALILADVARLREAQT